MWFHIASHLHMTVGRCMAEMTSTEFVKWSYYLSSILPRQRAEEFNPTHWYLARIAMAIFEAARPKKKFQLRKFLLKWVFENDKVLAPEDIKTRTALSKAKWKTAIFGARKYPPGHPLHKPKAKGEEDGQRRSGISRT